MSLGFQFLGLGFEDERREAFDNIGTQEVAPLFDQVIMLLGVQCTVGW